MGGTQLFALLWTNRKQRARWLKPTLTRRYVKFTSGPDPSEFGEPQGVALGFPDFMTAEFAFDESDGVLSTVA